MLGVTARQHKSSCPRTSQFSVQIRFLATFDTAGKFRPPLRHLRVNGVELSYSEQGTGAPVVFVHGAFSNLRIWEAQRQAVAQQYRFIPDNRRYHGTAPWPDEGQHYAAATHAADLAAFIRQLNAGSVHLVAH